MTKIKHYGRGPDRAEYIQGLFNTIVPPGCIGEQYADDVALIFKVKRALVQTKTKYQKVDIVETDYWGKILFLDNLLMKAEKDGHIINEMIVHPIMLTGNRKKRVLVVGGGEGFTATELLKYPYIEKIDIIDIDTEFIEISKKFFPQQMACLKDPRVKIFTVDGLEFLRQTTEKYDAIFTTPTDPLALSDPLFIDEYYRLSFDRLTDDGIYETDAYMPFYKYGKIDYAYIRKMLAKYFPVSKIYTATVPTFPGGLFSFGFASKKFDPEKDFHPQDLPKGTRYYNAALHSAAFKLPQFMLDRIEEENKR
ncbi:spermidine synthase [Candidatus Microgenomates bacterium]|nr:spermidine synthase [Candidatus Microgenomates bacterium]